MSGLTLAEIRFLRSMLLDYRPRSELEADRQASLLVELNRLRNRVEASLSAFVYVCSGQVYGFGSDGSGFRPCADCTEWGLLRDLPESTQRRFAEWEV